MRAGRARIAVFGIVALVTVREARSQEPEPGGPTAPTSEPTPSEPAEPRPDVSGPVLFADSAPLLPEIWRLASADDAGPKALAAGLAVLDDWLAHPSASSDPLARATGEWLRALLLTRRHAHEAAYEAWEALATTPGAFSDEARRALAELEPGPRGRSTKGQGGSAHWLLSRSPGAPGYLEGVRKAVKDLTRRKQGERAAELLARALELGMAGSMRKELVLLRADLLPRAERRALLFDLWWLDDDRTPDARVTQRLKKLDALPDADQRLFRDALATDRSDVEQAKKALAKLRKRPAIAPIVNALYDRFDDESAGAALAKLPEHAADPTFLAYTRGILLRKLDRDDEAVAAFEAVIAAAPDHPLADLARAQASVLLRGLGRPDAARGLDETLLASAPPGELQRDALWRLGFAAVIAGDGAAAETYLRALETRFGGDPDRHSFSWYERARYWRGRAALLRDDRGVAREHFEAVVARFPAGWYALLARDRLMGPGRAFKTTRAAQLADAEALWDVPRDDPMATALALYRLGAEDEARKAFDALLQARQLPGNGRKLLADLYDLEGRHKDADRVLKYAAIPATMPGDDPDDLYLAWYPFVHGDAVTEAAKDNHVPSQLLAGIVSVETRFQEKGRSKVGAIGLAQLMPTTGQAVGKKLFGQSFSAAQLWDPATNLAVAAKYLGSLLDRFAGHPALAVLAYNAGPAPVKRWLAQRGELELDAFVETIPFEQARRYVMRVCSDAEIYRRLYGLEREPLALPRKFAVDLRRGER